MALGSDAFFPFGDNIERAHKSGVKYVAEPGGSVRDDNVIETCNKYGMVMSFTESVYSITNFKGTGYGHAESVRRIINSKIQTQKQPFGNIQMAVFVFG